MLQWRSKIPLSKTKTLRSQIHKYKHTHTHTHTLHQRLRRGDAVTVTSQQRKEKTTCYFTPLYFPSCYFSVWNVLCVPAPSFPAQSLSHAWSPLSFKKARLRFLRWSRSSPLPYSPTHTALLHFSSSSEFIYVTLPDRVNLEGKADTFWLWIPSAEHRVEAP